MTERHWDVIVVGSGPAGTSVAWPMIDGGLSVLMLEGGHASVDNTSTASSLAELRANESLAWQSMVGPAAYEHAASSMSPKLKMPASHQAIIRYREAYPIACKGFSLHGFLAPGGMSSAWGAGACAFSEEELAGYPIALDDLWPSYRVVSQRIGISGVDDDDLAEWLGRGLPLQPPLPLHEGAAILMARYERRKATTAFADFRVGRVRQAVLTEGQIDRRACSLCNLCLWGCPYGSIYSAASELPHLAARRGFEFRSGCLVTAVRRDDANFYRVTYRRQENQSMTTVTAKHVVLAAGTIGSTILAFGSAGRDLARLRLHSTPVVAFVLGLPSLLGRRPSQVGFGMGQLVFSVMPLRIGEQKLYGAIFATDGLPVTELIQRLPFARPNALLFSRALWPALLLCSCFFPSTLSDHEMTLSRDADGCVQASIAGGASASLSVAVGDTIKRLRRAFRRLGAFIIPGSVTVAAPGSDLHYAGTLPMRRTPNSLETDRWGRLGGSGNLFVVDGAALPTLPSKAHTLTIMANADRIGRYIVAHEE